MSDSNNEQKKFSVQGKKPKAFELNKKLIATVGAILGIAVIFAFLFSINTGPEQQHSTSSSVKGPSVNQKTDKSAVDKLPSGYQDKDQIDKMLGLNKKPKVVEKVPLEIEQRLQAMREQQSRLQSELSRLRDNKQPEEPIMRQPEEPSENLTPMDREAMSAAIFFPGGAPRPIPQSDKKKTTVNQDGRTVDVIDTAQEEKLKFMSGKVNKDVTNQNTIQNPISKYTIFAGSAVPGILKTKLVSSTPGSIVAIVSQDVYDTVTGQYLLIPKGSTLLGTYNSKVSYGDYQLQAKFIRLIRPDGSSIILPNQVGVDGKGVSGFEDEVDNHWGQLIGAAALTTVFNIPAVAAQYAQNQAQQFNGNGFNTPSASSTFSNAALQGLGQSASQIGNKLTSRAMNINPTITINDGYQFSILITKDLILPPYDRKMSR